MCGRAREMEGNKMFLFSIHTCCPIPLFPPFVYRTHAVRITAFCGVTMHLWMATCSCPTCP